MTNFADNILSGVNAVVTAQASLCPVQLSRHYAFNGASSTQNGVFPSNTKNLTAEIFITNAGSATTHNAITVSAGGVTLLTIDQFGSAVGYANDSKAGVARFTLVASACAIVQPVAGAANTGEAPFAVTYNRDAGDPSSTCQINLKFNRKL
jgi:hypothetical protein